MLNFPQIMRTLTAQHSISASDDELSYPFLRSLLKFDTRETLNVLSLAFMEKEFSSELGMSQRQRIINILLEIIDGDDDEVSYGEKTLEFRFNIHCL
jgi:vacuolar protein sorting-associated protein 8